MGRIVKIFRWAGFFLVTLIGLILFCNVWILFSTRSYIYDDIDSVPSRPVALILGTSKSMDGKYINPYFQDRIEAGLDLYQQKKIGHIIVSGDNSLVTYNEPRDMRQALMDQGMESDRISMDFAGFRTYDSVVRCKEVFGQDEIIIVSQPFHNPRAVFIARQKGIDAVAVNSRDDYTSWFSEVYWREVLARCKTIVDIYILNKQPKYLGEKVKIDLKQES